jgi:hypothetical protein
MCWTSHGTYNCAYKIGKIGESGLATLRAARGSLLSRDQGVPWQRGGGGSGTSIWLAGSCMDEATSVGVHPPATPTA